MATICSGCHSRREILAGISISVVGLSNVSAARAAVIKQGPPPVENNEFVQKLLERSKANKEKYDRERLESYYKRNYTDYFEYIKRVSGKKNTLSKTEEAINDWLEKNKK